MSFDVHDEKVFQADPQKVYQTALKVVEKFQGKLVSSDAARTRIEAKFPKTVLGKTLGDRCQVVFQINPAGEASQVVADGYPLDAIERKLMFGARAGVTATVITWFFAHLEHNLK
ncbi:MAG TPA: hypothetical protein VGK00_01825 [Anaerolineales bacterium]|jgi:hypothetical protein